jgi:tRNA dimethylallyltransferase
LVGSSAAGGRAGPPAVRVICGPTAAGKSAIAMRLAERFGALVVSADSRQIYRGFDVGTAKPSPDDRCRVPHRGIDVVAPTERYSAAQWAADADSWIDDAGARGVVPLVVGGTGFYLRALFEPLFESPPFDEPRRRALEPLLGAMPVAELRRWCERLDPARANLGRAQLLRSVETGLLLGERLSDLHVRHARAARRAARYLVVDPGPALHERIARRAGAMLDGGWVEEVEGLMRSVPADAPAWKASGYDVVRRLALGQLGRPAAEALVVIETRQYAKRQRTWFRHQLAGADVTRVDPDDPGCNEVITRWWEAEGPSRP